jgi:hypothetical protein
MMEVLVENDQQVRAQLEFIERMIRQGQDSLEQWGWAFVLWGVGHLAALGWSLTWSEHPEVPWMVVMTACGLATGVRAARFARPQGGSTAIGRALAAVWWAFGISMGLVWLVGGATHLFGSGAAFMGAFFLLVGAPNFVTGLTLRLRSQVVVGLAWWAGAVVAWAMPQLALGVYVTLALLCEVGFGLHLMALERHAAQAHARVH